jgi:hypothetical protein
MPFEAQQTHEQYIRPVNYLLHIPDGYGQDTLKKVALTSFSPWKRRKGLSMGGFGTWSLAIEQMWP